MPCEKCENGKYKWGKTGSCTYDSVAECEEANKDYYEYNKHSGISNCRRFRRTSIDALV